MLGTGSDLHTVAHEAAHVVQQRAGVHLKGGVGEAGDAHERHADEVADAVVQGKSAEGLLDRYAGGAGGATDQVQHTRHGKHGHPLTMVEQGDHLVASATDNTVVGWKHGGAWFAAVNNGTPVGLGAATVGQLTGSHTASIVEMRKLTGSAGSWVLNSKSAAMVVEGDRVLGELATGTRGNWKLHGVHGSPNKLPAELASVIAENDKLELGNHSTCGWAIPTG